MFENQGGKEFIDVSQEMGEDFLRVGYQRGSAFADLNNDGFMDLVVTSLNRKPRILINSADNGNLGQPPVQSRIRQRPSHQPRVGHWLPASPKSRATASGGILSAADHVTSRTCWMGGSQIHYEFVQARNGFLNRTQALAAEYVAGPLKHAAKRIGRGNEARIVSGGPV